MYLLCLGVYYRISAGCVCLSVFSPGFCEVLSADQFRVASSAHVCTHCTVSVCVCLCACACTCAYMHVCMYVVCMYIIMYLSVCIMCWLVCVRHALLHMSVIL